MARSRRSFTELFKKEAVALARQRDTSVLSVARNLGINPSTLYHWVNLEQPTRRGDADQQLSDDPQSLKLQLKEAQKRIERLEMERDILKKATAFFANQSP